MLSESSTRFVHPFKQSPMYIMFLITWNETRNLASDASHQTFGTASAWPHPWPCLWSQSPRRGCRSWPIFPHPSIWRPHIPRASQTTPTWWCNNSETLKQVFRLDNFQLQEPTGEAKLTSRSTSYGELSLGKREAGLEVLPQHGAISVTIDRRQDLEV